MRIISGKLRGKKIEAPLIKTSRPTSDRTREMIFNILEHNSFFGRDCFVHKNVLDVFAGSGSLGLEAYSRGANTITFIEHDPHVLKNLQKNLKICDLSLKNILPLSILEIPNAPVPQDLIFMDPPYHHNLILPAFQKLESSGWITTKSTLILEISKDEVLPDLPGFEVLITRTSGAAKIHFLKYKAL